MSFLYINQVTQAVKDHFPQVTIKDILSIPFPTEEHLKQKGRQDQMVALVERSEMELHKQLAAAQNSTGKGSPGNADRADRPGDRPAGVRIVRPDGGRDPRGRGVMNPLRQRMRERILEEHPTGERVGIV